MIFLTLLQQSASLMRTRVIVSSSGPNKVINVGTAASKIHHSQDVCPLGLFSSVPLHCPQLLFTWKTFFLHTLLALEILKMVQLDDENCFVKCSAVV